MSRTEHDQFIDDDEEETCPLCVEEFDITDKGFRPCPCGYQVRFDPSFEESWNWATS
jgi:CCR4-NOT transcription complex subunit 4